MTCSRTSFLIPISRPLNQYALRCVAYPVSAGEFCQCTKSCVAEVMLMSKGAHQGISYMHRLKRELNCTTVTG